MTVFFIGDCEYHCGFHGQLFRSQSGLTYACSPCLLKNQQIQTEDEPKIHDRYDPNLLYGLGIKDPEKGL